MTDKYIKDLTENTSPATTDAIELDDGTNSKYGTVANIVTAALNSNKVTLAQMANMATDSLIGRDTAGTGTPEVLSAATVKTMLGVSEADVQTLTNKRITPRVGTATSSATPTINTDNIDFYHLTAQAVDITSFTTNLSGTPTNAQKLWIAVTGTAARAITWGASFEAGAATLPTTTTTTQRLDVGFIWNAVTSKWRCMASGSA